MIRCIFFVIGLLLSIKANATSYQYNLAIGAIFKDEAPYLKEWIEFHKLLGVQYFYLYNNLSSDNYQEVLQPYIDRGLVELIEWPYSSDNLVNWNAVQCAAYMDCIRYSIGKAKWIAFLDTDEYLFPVEEDNLTSFLENYEDCVGVTANWIMFGTSWVNKIPEDSLLIEMLHLRENSNGNPHVKSIVRPEYIQDCENPHFFIYKPGYAQVTADKIPFSGPFAPYISIEKIRINHYWTRDEYYLMNFKIPRHKSWGVSVFTDELLNYLNAHSDTAIFRFIPRLNSSLFKI